MLRLMKVTGGRRGGGKGKRRNRVRKREHVSRKVIKVTDNELERACSYLQSINVIN